jgi:uncharacterized membrane protein YidH (DUF202 family)
MTAALTGLGSGALHAVAGPDHVLSLAPLSIGRLRGAWRVGLSWGLGHGAGTLLLALAASALPLEAVGPWAARLAGLALAATGVSNWYALSRTAAGEAPRPARGSVLVVGLVHGVTGATALLLLLPALTGLPGDRALYLGGFTLGSTVAMAGLTAALASLPRAGRIAAAATRRLPRVASALSVLAGIAWVALA